MKILILFFIFLFIDCQISIGQVMLIVCIEGDIRQKPDYNSTSLAKLQLYDSVQAIGFAETESYFLVSKKGIKGSAPSTIVCYNDSYYTAKKMTHPDDKDFNMFVSTKDREKAIEKEKKELELEINREKERQEFVDKNESNKSLKSGTMILLKKGATLSHDSLINYYQWDEKTEITGTSNYEVQSKLKELINDSSIFIEKDPTIYYNPKGDKCWVGGTFNLGNVKFSGYIKIYGEIAMSMSGADIFGRHQLTASSLNILIKKLTLIEILEDTEVSIPISATSIQKNYSVKDAQLKLKKLGYDPGPIDGKFGTKTEDSLKAFQKDNHLSITGKLDKNTIESLVNK